MEISSIYKVTHRNMNANNFSATLMGFFEIHMSGKFLQSPSFVRSVRNVIQLLFEWIMELLYLTTKVYILELMFHA